MLEPDSFPGPVYAGNILPVGTDPAKAGGTSTGSWKKPLGITIIVVGSVVGGLAALYSLGTAPSACGEDYEGGSPEKKECEKESSQARLGFLGGLVIVEVSIAGGITLIKMSRNRTTSEAGDQLVTNNYDVSLQWTHSF